MAQTIVLASFVSKLSDANAEAAETQVWLDFALQCGYIDQTLHTQLYSSYKHISGGLIKMIAEPDSWCGPATIRETSALYDIDSLE